MESLSRILLVIERDQRVHAGLAKALLLARHTGARLELFLCDTAGYCGESPLFTGEPAQERRQRSAREYLRSLRQAIVASDVPIDVQTAYDPSLARAVIDRLRHEPAQLVVRTRAEAPGASMSFAKQLVQSGTPIILTQGRPWQPTPQFMLALLIDPRGGAGQSASLVPSTPLVEMLGRRCGARVDYVVASAEVLPRVVTQRDYDLITLADAPVQPNLSSTSADVLFVSAARGSGATANAAARGFKRI